MNRIKTQKCQLQLKMENFRLQKYFSDFILNFSITYLLHF